VRKLRGTQTPEARVVIVTAPGQEAQVDPLIRELVQYRDFINYRTKEIEE
jgi:hypothetical protein